LLQRLGIGAGNCDVRNDAVEEQQKERHEDPATEILGVPELS